jgi:hypothetical protein
VVLNRVLSADPSQIYGSLTANGIVFLINPQGVLIGHGAEVNVVCRSTGFQGRQYGIHLSEVGFGGFGVGQSSDA